MNRSGVGLAVLALVLAASQGRAQDLEILDRGKPVAEANVTLGGQVVGTTNSAGGVSFNPDALNFTKGETVEVWVKDCEDGRVEIVLAREGSDDPCADEGAEAGERCGCRRIGAFIWGDGPVTIDIGTGTVTQATTGAVPTADGEDHSFADLQIGAMFDYSWFYQLEDTVCGRPGVVSCDTDNGVPGVGAYLDYRFGRSNFGMSLEAHYASLDAESTTEDGGRTTFDVNSWQFQAAGVYNVPLSPRAGWYIRSGYALMYNDGDVTGDTGSESRSETGSRWLAGTGLHWPMGENWCARTGFDLTTGFDSEDGDTNGRWSLAFGYRVDRN